MVDSGCADSFSQVDLYCFVSTVQFPNTTMPLSVKFQRASASPRIANFSTWPKWGDLVNKVKEIFHIPAEKVAIEVLNPTENRMISISNDTDLLGHYNSLRALLSSGWSVHNKDSPDCASPSSASHNLCSMPLYLVNTFTTWYQASTFSGSLSFPDDSKYAFYCLIQGKVTPFKVTLSKTDDVEKLKKAVWKEGEHSSFQSTDAQDLVLYKVCAAYGWLPVADTFLAQ
jgi:hypothetical protein